MARKFKVHLRFNRREFEAGNDYFIDGDIRDAETGKRIVQKMEFQSFSAARCYFNGMRHAWKITGETVTLMHNEYEVPVNFEYVNEA